MDSLKKSYQEYVPRYALPQFDELIRFFDIDRIDFEPHYVLRGVRQMIIHKIVEYVKLVEMLLTPSSAPPSFLLFSKRITVEERTLLQQLYEQFTLLELRALELDIAYNEEHEAAHITSAFNLWAQHCDTWKQVFAMMRRNFTDLPERKERSYFG